MAGTDFSDPRINEGIRLFNEREFFACHDVFEDYWSELTSAEKPFFQGLIQAAVALFHFEGGNLGGARRMYLSSRAYLMPFAPETAAIDVQRLLEDLDTCFDALCVPRSTYPTDVRLETHRIPTIHRRPEGTSHNVTE